MSSIENKKEIISNRINSIIDMDIKKDECDHYTEYAIFLQDEVMRSNDDDLIDKLYEKIVTTEDLFLSSSDLYEQYDLLNKSI